MRLRLGGGGGKVAKWQVLVSALQAGGTGDRTQGVVYSQFHDVCVYSALWGAV